MPRLTKSLLSVLTILVVACAQVCGIQRGFLCEHQDAPFLTQAEHCHTVVNTSGQEFVPCASAADADCCQQDGTEHHAPQKLDMSAARTAPPIFSSPSFIAILVAEVPAFDWAQEHLFQLQAALRVPADSGSNGPPESTPVAHCTVMLV
jgi:hypothetical protein